MKLKWKDLKIGDTVIFDSREKFDNPTKAVITQISKDHAIAEGDGMKLWLDDDTKSCFRW